MTAKNFKRLLFAVTCMVCMILPLAVFGLGLLVVWGYHFIILMLE